MTAIAEQYARATLSANLKNDDRHFDADKLVAVALSSDLGSLLFRVKYANDATSYKSLEEKWGYAVRLRAVMRQWPTNIKECSLAQQALEYWLNDLCRPCNGKGHLELQPRVLSDDPCPHCNGTGRRDIPANRHTDRYLHDLVDMLDGLVREAAGAAMRKLAANLQLD